jgi:hypothetical protein
MVVPRLVELAAGRTGKPVVAYPNRGGTWDPARKRWTGDDAPGGFGPLTLELRAAVGVLLVALHEAVASSPKSKYAKHDEEKAYDSQTLSRLDVNPRSPLEV